MGNCCAKVYVEQKDVEPHVNSAHLSADVKEYKEFLRHHNHGHNHKPTPFIAIPNIPNHTNINMKNMSVDSPVDLPPPFRRQNHIDFP